ncbi:MAG: septum formation initiator family protein [Oscillospiraceae bacterium]|nr:septum formation initiator family protein [Oscillospiraceae bacterium]
MKKRKKRTGLLIRAAAAVFILYAVISLTVLQAKINRQRETSRQLSEQIAEQMVLGAGLREATGSEPDPAALARLAREKLGYVFPGEIVLVDVSK